MTLSRATYRALAIYEQCFSFLRILYKNEISSQRYTLKGKGKKRKEQTTRNAAGVRKWTCFFRVSPGSILAPCATLIESQQRRYANVRAPFVLIDIDIAVVPCPRKRKKKRITPLRSNVNKFT